MTKFVDANAIEWSRYPYVARSEHARAWISCEVLCGKSSETVEKRARAVNDFLAFCDRLELLPVTMTRAEAAQYAMDLHSRPGKSRSFGAGLSSATVYQQLIVVHAFFAFLVVEGLRQYNPLDRDRPTTGTRTQHWFDQPIRRMPWIPSDEDWGAFLRAVADAPLVTFCMAMLAFEAGLSGAELCGMRTDDLNPAGKLFRVRADSIADITHDRLENAVLYSDVVSELLHRYLEHRQTLTTSPGPLFLFDAQGTVAQPFTVRMWSKIVRQIALQAELPHFTTRTFRQPRVAFRDHDFRDHGFAVSGSRPHDRTP